MTSLATTLPDSLTKVLADFLEKNPQPVFRFRTLDANTYQMPVQNSDNTVTPRPVSPSRSVPGAVVVRAPEGHQVRLMYSNGKTKDGMVGGLPTIVDVPQAIWFEAQQHCLVEVRRTDREQLARLLFSNECRNGLNPAKEEPDSGCVYELVQPEKTAADLAALKRLVGKAQGKLENATESELAKACERCEQAVSPDANTNYSALFDLAQQEPQRVLNALSDEFDKHEAFVADLLGAGVIEFDQTTRQFLILPARTTLLVVPTGPQDTALVKYLIETNEGKKIKPTLKGLLDAKAKKK